MAHPDDSHRQAGLREQGDRWAPVTEEMGFLELGTEQAAQAFATWYRGLPTSQGSTIEVLPVLGSLRVVAVPHTLRKDGGGRYGAVMLDMYGPEQPGRGGCQ